MMHGWQSERTDGSKGGRGSESLILFVSCLSLSNSLYLSLSVCLSLCPSISLVTYIYIYISPLSIYVSISLSNQPSIHVFCCPAIYPSTYLPIDPYPFLCLSINFQQSLYLVFLCLSYLSICLSVHLSLNVSLPISLYKSLSLSLFIHLCICLSLFLFGCLHLSADLAI